MSLWLSLCGLFTHAVCKNSLLAEVTLPDDALLQTQFWVLCTACSTECSGIICNGICVQVQTETAPCLLSKSATKLCTLLFWSMLFDAKLNGKPLRHFCICKTAEAKTPVTRQGEQQACGRGNILLRFISSLHSLSLFFSVCLWLSASLILKIELQTWVPFLGQGAPVVLWESIQALALLLNPGYVNHQETTPTNNDSPQFNCITALFRQGNQRWCVCVRTCKGRAALVDSFPAHWNYFFSDFNGDMFSEVLKCLLMVDDGIVRIYVSLSSKLSHLDILCDQNGFWLGTVFSTSCPITIYIVRTNQNLLFNHNLSEASWFKL